MSWPRNLGALSGVSLMPRCCREVTISASLGLDAGEKVPIHAPCNKAQMFENADLRLLSRIMRAASSLLTLSTALAAAISAAPLTAQSSARDFQLPSSATPAPTPSAEGPVDDSGPVPVAPRPASTPTPAPAPSPTPTSVLRPTPTPTQAPTQAPTSAPTASRPVVQPIPTSTSRAQPAPQTRRVPQPSQTRVPVGREDLPSVTAIRPEQEAQIDVQTGENAAPTDIEAETGTPTSAPAETTSSPPAEQNADTADTADTTRTMPQWLIWAGTALLALLAGLFFWRRRKSARSEGAELLAAPLTKAPATEPEIEPVEPAEPSETTETVSKKPAPAPPLAKAPEETLDAATIPNLDLKLEIEQLSRSMMMMSLKCRVTLSNRSDKAARDVIVSADLVTANRALPMEAQTAGETAFLPEIGSNDRIGPHKTFSAPTTLTLPIQQLSVFKQGDKPLCVPLVRVRMDAKGAEPLYRTFVIGIAADPSLTASTKLHPVPLDGIPGSFPNVRSRAL